MNLSGLIKPPAIINTADGGLIKPDKFNSELIYFVSQIPYNWIFPKMYAVIHHGGAGTTHLAIKYGCAAMIIPHIVDQFVWDKMISDLGVGPKGIKINRINSKKPRPKDGALFSPYKGVRHATLRGLAGVAPPLNLFKTEI